uniref:MofA protein n=1 Tax=Leptothrix discophora TaxID=89 RepID=P71431_LEPDI|nr:mofA [Leptothrix discophora]
MRKSTGFHRTPVAAATGLLALLLGAAMPAQAGVGFGAAIDRSGADMNKTNGNAVRSYFAHSPRGERETLNPDSISEADALFGAGKFTGRSATDTGKALRKFIDPLPLPGKLSTLADGVTQRTIPVAVPAKWINPQTGAATSDDYFEIALVEYKQKLHSDLKNPTTLRGYVQLSVDGTGLYLYYPNSSGKVAFANAADAPADAKPVMINAVDAKGFMTGAKVQARVVMEPHMYGPLIQARKGTPTRLKFVNLLPGGRAETTVGADGKVQVTARNGDIFLPLDKSIAHAGLGPDGFTEFTQNRSNIHLHGGDTPWISDGTPHQWITPIEEANAANPKALVNQGIDPEFLPSFLRGASAQNVPDMPDPGAGASTYYFPNGQSARMLWYHDHTIGVTRLNVYAGMAAVYTLGDEVDDQLTGKTTGGALNKVLPPAEDTIPLVLTDRTFVPADVALQDARWNTSAWGGESDSWFPHVYETVQDPNQMNGFNSVGRWHWGPWFWPVFPAMYDLPSGEYGDVTVTPEAWMDTPLVNGVAYPTIELDPKVYRMKVLNASNDRFFNISLFVADEAQRLNDPLLGGATEVKMVDAAVSATPCAAGVTRAVVATDGSYCTPETWPTDNRPGGVPSPAAQGPSFFQIANEGGLLPKVAEIAPTPVGYQLDKGRITVLNVLTTGLYLGNAERADVLVDLSAYAGKTLIVYNDSGAPVPAGDPRNDYFTAVGDQSDAGGAEDTKPGYGPNTRTMMQIKVRAAITTPVDGQIATLDSAAIDALKAEIPKAYAIAQEKPVVGQDVYNQALGTSWGATPSLNGNPGNFADIFTGSLKQPVFNYVPGEPHAGFNSVKVTSIGAGYTSAPTVSFADPSVTTESGAKAQATLKIGKVNLTDPGSGYTIAPQVTITAVAGGGSGAMGEAHLAVDNVIITNGGAGYTSAPTVKFSSSPKATAGNANGATAEGVAVISGGKVIGVTVTNPGFGYAGAPTVSFQGGGATSTARGTTTGYVADVSLIAPDPLQPIVIDPATGIVTSLGSAGGGGYTDLNQVTVAFNGGVAPAGGTAATATVTGSVFDITMLNNGSGYTNATTVTLTGGGAPNGSVAKAEVDTKNGVATGSHLVKTKAIHELFEPVFGRMNAILAVEIPFTSALTQTTIPLAMIDAPTERFADGETQIWKITHNGVDTHPVHFHLLNVQLINRVGWDGWIEPPAANEIGWKETIRMNPLEDVIVAVRAKRPPLPGFGVPNSIRPMDPSQPLGSSFGFTQIDPLTGNPQSVVNAVMNYQWEYVWHCHILGHEENDFMRPIVFEANEAVPLAPTTLALKNGASTLGATSTAATTVTEITWVDQSQTEYQYLVERSLNGGAWQSVGTSLANATSHTLATPVAIDSGSKVDFRVTAVGANGTASASASVSVPPANVIETPTGLVSMGVTSVNNNLRPSVTLNWIDASRTETEFQVWRKVTGSTAPAVLVGTVTRNAAATAALGGVVSFVDGSQPNGQALLRPAFGTSYDYTIVARKTTNPTSKSVDSAALTVKIGTRSPVNAFGADAPVLTSVGAVRAATTGTAANTDTVVLGWTEEATNSNSSYAVQYRSCATQTSTSTTCRYPVTDSRYWGAWTAGALVPAAGGAANSTGGSFSITNQRVRNKPAQVQVQARNSIGSSAWSAALDVTLP